MLCWCQLIILQATCLLQLNSCLDLSRFSCMPFCQICSYYFCAAVLVFWSPQQLIPCHIPISDWHSKPPVFDYLMHDFVWLWKDSFSHDWILFCMCSEKLSCSYHALRQTGFKLKIQPVLIIIYLRLRQSNPFFFFLFGDPKNLMHVVIR